MPESREFLLRHARLDAASVEAWIEAGWLAPRGGGGAGPEPPALSGLDLARACLIRDLRDGLGVNDEGIAVVLDLVDQIHGLRLALGRLGAAFRAVPAPLRQELLAQLRVGAELERAPEDPA